MEAALNQLLSIPPWVALAIVAMLVFSEAALFVGFVIPGETAVVIAGVLASIDHLSLWVVLLVVIASAIIGDSVGYEVGRHLGPRLLTLGPLKRHQARIAQAQEFLRNRGGAAVFIGRFTAFLRAMMPALAGVSGIHYPRFLAFNALGGIVWGGGCVLAGYFAGKSFHKVAHWLGMGSAIMVGVVVVAGLLVWHFRRRAAERRNEPE